MGPSDDERRLLEDLRQEGFEVASIGSWLLQRPETWAGAEEVLLGHLESCRDDGLTRTLATLLARRGWRPALPALIAKLRSVRGRTAEFHVARAIAGLGVAEHEDALLAALADVRTAAARRMLDRALRKAGVEPPLAGYMARQARIVGGVFAAVLAVVGGLTLGLSPLIVEKAGRLVLAPEIVAGAAAIALAVAVWRRWRWTARLYALWAVATVAFHLAYQAGAQLFAWKQFLLVESVGVAVLLLGWRLLVRRLPEKA